MLTACHVHCSVLWHHIQYRSITVMYQHSRPITILNHWVTIADSHRTACCHSPWEVTCLQWIHYNRAALINQKSKLIGMCYIWDNWNVSIRDKYIAQLSDVIHLQLLSSTYVSMCDMNKVKSWTAYSNHAFFKEKYCLRYPSVVCNFQALALHFTGKLSKAVPTHLLCKLAVLVVSMSWENQ